MNILLAADLELAKSKLGTHPYSAAYGQTKWTGDELPAFEIAVAFLKVASAPDSRAPRRQFAVKEIAIALSRYLDLDVPERAVAAAALVGSSKLFVTDGPVITSTIELKAGCLDLSQSNWAWLRAAARELA